MKTMSRNLAIAILVGSILGGCDDDEEDRPRPRRYVIEGAAGSAEYATGIAAGPLCVAATVPNPAGVPKIQILRFDISAEGLVVRGRTIVDADSDIAYASGKLCVSGSSIYAVGKRGKGEGVIAKVSDTGGDVVWIAGAPKTNSLVDCAVASSGDVFAVGAGEGLLSIFKFTPDGASSLFASYGGTNCEAGGIAVAPTGEVFVVGTIGTDDRDLVLLKYESDGRRSADVVWDGGLSGKDEGIAVQWDPSGVVVCGTASDEWLIAKYDLGLKRLWARFISASGAPQGIAMDAETVRVFGTVGAGAAPSPAHGGTAAAVATLHREDGHLESFRLHSSANGNDSLAGAAVTPYGVVVAGFVGSSAGEPDLFVAMQEADGSIAGMTPEMSRGGAASGTHADTLRGTGADDYLRTRGGVDQAISGRKTFFQPLTAMDKLMVEGSAAFSKSVQVQSLTSTGDIKAGGTLLLSSGSAGSPSLSFSGDSLTGLHSSKPGTLSFDTGGKERMRIDASGNVGIGTSNPTSILTLRGDADQTIQMEKGSIRASEKERVDGMYRGGNLTLKAGDSARSGLGGTLILSSGGGYDGSSILFKTAGRAGEMTAEATPVTRMSIEGGWVRIGRTRTEGGRGNLSVNGRADISGSATVGTGLTVGRILHIHSALVPLTPLQVDGSIATAIQSVGPTGEKTITSADSVLIAAPPATLILPRSDIVSKGRQYTIKRTGKPPGDTVIIKVDKGGKIDGDASRTLTQPYQYVTVVADGEGNWYVVAGN